MGYKTDAEGLEVWTPQYKMLRQHEVPRKNNRYPDTMGPDTGTSEAPECHEDARETAHTGLMSNSPREIAPQGQG